MSLIFDFQNNKIQQTSAKITDYALNEFSLHFVSDIHIFLSIGDFILSKQVVQEAVHEGDTTTTLASN